MMAAPSRPILRYFGGKWRLAPWIISYFPPHRVYVEPFGGAASTMLRKERAYAEVYNDSDGEIVNLFTVARDRGAELVALLEMTPFARDEYALAHEPANDPLERARRTVVRSFMGFGADALHSAYRSGFRANSNKSGSTPAHDWVTYPAALAAIVNRLRGVVIENRPALSVMAQHDSPDTLHYVDPPYVHSTRSRASVHGYAYEMDDAEHEELLTFLLGVRGMVAISGYRNVMYDRMLEAWRREEVTALADGARERIEVLWLSPSLCAALSSGARDPFGFKA